MNFSRYIKAASQLLCAGALVISGTLTALAAGDATLNRLEIKVGGENILTGFNKNTKTYDVELEEGSASLATFSAAPSSDDATVDISINGKLYTNHSLGSLIAGDNVVTYTIKSGSSTEVYTINIKTPQVVRQSYFTWKNANIYFVLTDRFYNGDSSNDESYHRHKIAAGIDVATFHGGDIKGLTQKLDYLNNLGVNAIWITAPYEQMHGWTGGKDDAFPHYAFHGYYTLDWTFMDRNMGTIDDMREFVTEAHRRGIRVVMDIVLNHTAYATLDDCVDYGFGNFNGTPTAGYVPSSGPFTMWGSGSVSFNAVTQGNWGKWWGPWVRAFGDRDWGTSAGFVKPGGDDKTMSLAGLPDVVTERSASVEIPAFLATKWNAEKGGDWDNYRLPNLDGWRVGGKGAPADYIINWLAGWVEYFGIDGFRCDTAKHVEFNRWNQLKNTCKQALARWRASDRADEYAKNWTDDFWMTGEAWGWDHGDTGYFSQGGFDSMINFAFNGTEGGSGRTPGAGDWEYYANFCNGTNGRQVLNYVSSHDTGLHRPGDQKKVGTMLLLCPGGAQIYYGDETSRPAVNGYGDAGMVTRGDFNWNAVDNDVNKHWQKVGQFRRRNPAVGAGTQSVINGCYVRKFSENGYSNAVAIKLDTQSGQSYTISTGDAFPDGTRVMDGYNTESTATVSGGKVTITASGPVILIEEYGTISDDPVPPTPSKPRVTASPAGGQFTDNVTVTLSATPADVAIHYSTTGVANASSPIYNSPLTFTETTTLSTFVENANGSNTQTFVYTKSQGNIEPEASCYIYFDDMSKTDVAVWAWKGNTNCTQSGSWPGDRMTQKDGKYYWALPEGKEFPTDVIISWSSGNDRDRAGGKDLKFVNKATYHADGTYTLHE
ncbi:MAG: chitobiase/beta-hexosaminidase C-terminal domain-containing protein [Muribaculaceae bacterium]|nr:chitobiase/beta-hexosaminidase C-terminal domain-containing protein [Muribaculaceae bacterium]